MRTDSCLRAALIAVLVISAKAQDPEPESEAQDEPGENLQDIIKDMIGQTRDQVQEMMGSLGDTADQIAEMEEQMVEQGLIPKGLESALPVPLPTANGDTDDGEPATDPPTDPAEMSTDWRMITSLCDDLDTTSPTVMIYSAPISTSDRATTMVPEDVKSTGTAVFAYDSNDISVLNARITWDGQGFLPPPENPTTEINGMHIHVGNTKENGPVLILFCGQGPLALQAEDGTEAPPCPQTQPAFLTGRVYSQENNPDGPPSPSQFPANDMLAEQAVVFNAYFELPGLYWNIHTPLTNNTQENGIIRGQLLKVEGSAADLCQEYNTM